MQVNFMLTMLQNHAENGKLGYTLSNSFLIGPHTKIANTPHADIISVSLLIPRVVYCNFENPLDVSWLVAVFAHAKWCTVTFLHDVLYFQIYFNRYQICIVKAKCLVVKCNSSICVLMVIGK